MQKLPCIINNTIIGIHQLSFSAIKQSGLLWTNVTPVRRPNSNGQKQMFQAPMQEPLGNFFPNFSVPQSRVFRPSRPNHLQILKASHAAASYFCHLPYPTARSQPAEGVGGYTWTNKSQTLYQRKWFIPTLKQSTWDSSTFFFSNQAVRFAVNECHTCTKAKLKWPKANVSGSHAGTIREFLSQF